MAAPKYTAAQNAIKRKGENEYPKQMWYLFLCIIAVATLNNVISILWAWYRRRARARGGNTASSQKKGALNIWRVPDAILAATRIFAFRWRIPAVSMTLLEALLGSIYIVALFTWGFANTQGLQLSYYADRSGHLAAAQCPLIVALASKNSAIHLLTGVSHEKLNLLHRTVSRVMLIMVWVHLWARWVIDHDIFEVGWLTAGSVSCIAQTLLTFISIRPIRRRFYESFFWSHAVLVIIFIATTYYHLYGADPKLVVYVWPCFIVWGFDRVCRYLRYVVNNFIKPKDIPGELEMLSEDSLRLTVKRHIPFGWRAGQHMFLAFPTLNPTQSHPFTISTLDNDKDKELMFIIRVRDGLTSTLKKRVLEKGTCQVPVLLEGPYGGPPDITPFTTCVFIAGGSGVTFTLPRMEDILQRVGAGGACAQRCVFIWAVRERSHIGWISRYLAKAITSIPEGVAVVVNIHITAANMEQLPDQPYEHGLSKNSSRDIEKDSKSNEISKRAGSGSVDSVDGLESLGVNIVQGRPNVFKILEEEVTNSEGPVSVDISGPEPLVKDVRKALSMPFVGPMATLKGTPLVQLNVEEFTM